MIVLGVPPRKSSGSGQPLQVRTRRSSSLAGFPLMSLTRTPVYRKKSSQVVRDRFAYHYVVQSELDRKRVNDNHQLIRS
jgi:hypothetical protein